MSTTTTASAAATNGACGSTLYDTPVHDAVCALPFSSNNTKIMAACCGDANVVSYYDDCGLYCLAIDQTVAELTECLLKEGAGDANVFCRGNTTDTATATKDGKLAATASASVVVTAGSSSDDDDDDSDATQTDDSDSDSTSTSTSSSTASDNAAPGVHPQPFVSTLGLALGALLFSATAIGAFQI
ncbi:hypothetical protein QQX98_010481 [Neonectria punicea]|uniref:Extracellular membrane protein CFEM domain-containing protein n=1 Tax=Neonectria punicea TaxID=979145 RepID=A0ABR1GPP4_9HYPO